MRSFSFKDIVYMMKVLVVILFSVAVLCLTACASTYTRLDLDKKYGVNIISGGIAGALIQGNLGGFVLGTFFADIVSNTLIEIKYQDKQIGTRDDAAIKHQYKNNKAQLYIEQSSLDIQTKGDKLTIEANVTYTLLAPPGIHQVDITEKRVICIDDRMMELDTRAISIEQGTHVSKAELIMPRDIPKGKYILLTTISGGNYKRTAKSVMDIS
jgi:hypothetical protein